MGGAPGMFDTPTPAYGPTFDALLKPVPLLFQQSPARGNAPAPAVGPAPKNFLIQRINAPDAAVAIPAILAPVFTYGPVHPATDSPVACVTIVTGYLEVLNTGGPAGIGNGGAFQLELSFDGGATWFVLQKVDWFIGASGEVLAVPAAGMIEQTITALNGLMIRVQAECSLGAFASFENVTTPNLNVLSTFPAVND